MKYTKGRTTAVLLATGAVVVAVVLIVSFWRDVRRAWFPNDADRIQGKWKVVSIDNAESRLRAFFPPTDLERIQGKWQFVSSDDSGSEGRLIVFKNNTVTFSWSVGQRATPLRTRGVKDRKGGRRKVARVSKGETTFTYSLDENHKPAEIDLVSSGGKLTRGIYNLLNGDAIEIILNLEGAPRPTPSGQKTHPASRW